MQSCYIARHGLGTGIPGFRFKRKEKNDMEKKLTEHTTHDFARIFANDINVYLEKGGSIDNLSATNVFNVVNDEDEEEQFTFTRNVVMSALGFRTEAMAIYYLMKHIKLQEGNFALSKDALPLLRGQIAGQKDYYRWDVIEYIRYFVLISNINIMSYRHVFEKMGDVSQLIKDVYMMVDLWKGGIANGEEARK